MRGGERETERDRERRGGRERKEEVEREVKRMDIDKKILLGVDYLLRQIIFVMRCR